jgi:hypothetical protein
MTVDLWIVCGAIVLMGLPIARFTIYQRRYRRIDDVVSFARRLSIEDFERITDPAEEWLLRRSMSTPEFKALQRQRMRLCAEYLSRVAHNGEIIQGWSYRDHTISRSTISNPGDEKTYLLWELSRNATEVRIFALITRLKVAVWLLLRADLLPMRMIPKLNTVRTTAGFNLLISYQGMTDLAKKVSQFYGPEWSDRMTGAL